MSSLAPLTAELTKYMAKPKNDTGVNLLSQDALPTKDMVGKKTHLNIRVVKLSLREDALATRESIQGRLALRLCALLASNSSCKAKLVWP